MDAKQTVPTKQVVVVKVAEKSINNKDIFFLFSVSQIEEVLSEIAIRSIPFSSDFVDGMCCWRGLVMPVVDLGSCFGLIENNHDLIDKQKYLVVRFPLPDIAGIPELKRCVVRVSDTIQMVEVTTGSTAVSSEEIGVNPSLIVGVFQKEERLYMVPDLVSILDNK